jgi:glycosyltransferase involved in cell wall biosynthesis
MTTPGGGDVEVTVVIPYFNPGARLRETLEEVVAALDTTSAVFEVVAVSDGSTDGSSESVASVAPGVVRHVVLPEQMGKGAAVRAGLEHGRGTYQGFIDGDGDIPPDLLADFVAITRERHPDMVVGNKRHPASQVVFPPGRRLTSWAYRRLVHLLFHLDVEDTQAGIKLLRRDVLDEVLPRLTEQGYALDLELLVAARCAGFRDVVEAPMRVRERLSSTISPVAVLAMVGDTFRIWWRLRVGHAYRPVGGTAPEDTDTARP